MLDARLRLPQQPYPGLRPFLDFEAPLLFGRERQVDEIVAKLAATQCVVVLGGSGSGKSSLVIAGVLPRLRSHGIRGAGDLWLPMVCTPGTNLSAAGLRASPVTRLAERFAGLLASRGSAEADAQRLDEIAGVFRQEAGFARLMEVYGGELALPDATDAADARLLVVIDQFEEVFHPSNQAVDDVRVLVERVLDQFYSPHPRCYVVLTMRSEFLNDCAAFIELPDAINRASYLVRRLDADELRDVITGPAQRFLRLLLRSGGERTLPAEVAFEPAVVDRVIADTQAISGDPDHLPLLQHLMARLWEAALDRESLDTPVPAQIRLEDLDRATSATAGAQVPGPDLNALRASLDHWAERAWGSMDDPGRAALLKLLPRLAHRDPFTGQYSQQRLAVSDAARLLGPERSPDDVRRLLSQGFLGGVDYLFWDDSSPARAMIKPSHESFIRGWRRFREAVDQHSRRLETLHELLQRAQAWRAEGRRDDWLLEAADTRRLLDDPDLENLLREDPEATALVLRRAPGERLPSPDIGTLQAYVDASRRRIRDRARLGARNRRLFVLALSAVLVPVVLFVVLVQTPTVARVTRLVDAANLAISVPPPDPDDNPAYTRTALQSMMAAAAQMDGALTGRDVALAAWSGPLLRHLAFMPWVGSLGTLLRGVIDQSESVVNARLRALLAQARSSHSNPWTALAAGERPALTQPAQPAQPGSACHELASGQSWVNERDVLPIELPGHCLLIGPAEQRPGRERMAAVYRRLSDAGRAPPAALLLPLGTITGLPAGGGAPAQWQLATAGTHSGWLLVSVPQVTGTVSTWGLPLTTCALWRAAAEEVPPAAGTRCEAP